MKRRFLKMLNKLVFILCNMAKESITWCFPIWNEELHAFGT